MENRARFRRFLAEFDALVDRAGDDEPTLLREGERLLGELVRHDDWLPQECAQASEESYRQYLLWCDPRERFSVVSFVWGPGQSTPVHDHTVWGLVAVLRGEERCEEFRREESGIVRACGAHPLPAGSIDKVSPTIGDLHRVSNALADRPSISIHVYGGNIGTIRRHVYDAQTGAARDFVSSYSNATLPNFWLPDARA
jgi:predicted metal-dependent enzyme (double-stranded beta helix superfamily)